MSMSSKEFVEYMNANVPMNRKIYLRNEFMCRYDSVIVSFWNLDISEVSRSNGATCENNRFTYTVDGFDISNVTIQTNRVKMKMLVCAYGKEYILRGKTGNPKDIADYILMHFAKIIGKAPI